MYDPAFLEKTHCIKGFPGQSDVYIRITAGESANEGQSWEGEGGGAGWMEGFILF